MSRPHTKSITMAVKIDLGDKAAASQVNIDNRNGLSHSYLISQPFVTLFLCSTVNSNDPPKSRINIKSNEVILTRDVCAYFSSPIVEFGSQHDIVVIAASSPALGREKASKYKGVYKCGKKWKTQVQIAGIQHYLGVFEKEEDAAKAYEIFLERHQLPDIAFDEHHQSTDGGFSATGNATICRSPESHVFCNPMIGNYVKTSPFEPFEGKVYWPASLVSSHSFNSLCLNELPSTFETEFKPKGNFCINTRKDASEYSMSALESFSSTTPTSLPTAAASFDQLCCKSNSYRSQIVYEASSLGYQFSSTNNTPDSFISSNEWERVWMRRILVGRLLYLSSCLYEQQFQIYMGSFEHLHEGKTANAKAQGIYNRRLKRKVGQGSSENIMSSSDLEGNILHGYLENCLSQLIGFPSQLL